MTSQQSRPAWFRLTALTNRAPTPAPIPSTAATRTSTPVATRPSTPAPATAPARPPIPGPGVVRPMIPTRPPSPPTAPAPAPPSPPHGPPRSPTKSPPASTPPLLASPQPSPRRAPAAPTPWSPAPSPPPATKSPVKTSPIQNATLVTSTNPPPSPTLSKSIDATEKIDHRRFEPLQRNPTPSLTPSPFTLPPAQAKTEHRHEPKIDQKNVLVQDKPMSKPRDYHNNAIPSIRKKEPTVKDKKLRETEEVGMRFVTLVGQNKGAVMELNPSHKKNYPSHILQKNEDTKSTTYKDKANKSNTMQSPSMATLNSNVQGINNSILFDCAFENTDPGIHLTLTRKPHGGFFAMDK